MVDCTNAEGHDAHMELNGECPWCYAVGLPDESLKDLTEEQAVAAIVARHG